MSIRRVLFIVPDLKNPEYKGGIQVFNNYMLQALDELGISTTVIGLNDRPQDAVDGLITCNRGKRIRKILAASHLMRRALFNRPDIVLCGHLHFAPLCRQIGFLTRLPFITITHGIELWNANPNRLRAVAASHRILAVSRYTRSRNLDLLKGYDPEHVQVFWNTFDEQRFQPGPVNVDLRTRLGLKPEHRVVLTVGRMTTTDRLKGYDEGIRAMAQVCAEVPDVRYVLAGQGNDTDRLRALGNECGLGDRLIMPGFIPEEDLVPLFNSSDLFILPSRKEGFGIVFLEVMGCGKPVIGGNRDGSMDPLCDGTLGTAIDPEDVDALANAIKDHLQGRVSRERSDADHLRREMVERFGFRRFQDRLQEVLASA
ncbi:MAG: glycosyltransferase family 4 protein [Planctomycetota bacterium]|nr:glycosyltransferase family 4 protein [Planctomycetota bacterium]